MSVPAAAPYLLWLVLDNDLTTLNRAVGLMRRHRLTLRGLATLPGPEAELATLTALVRAEPGLLDRVVQQLRKIVGVRDGAAVPLEPALPSPVEPITSESTS